MKHLTTVKIVTGVILFMLLMGVSFYLYALTVVEWWVPLCIAVILTSIMWLPCRRLWRRWFPDIEGYPAFIMHFLFLTSIFTCLLLAVNVLGADEAKAKTVPAEIVRKYEKKQYRSRRLRKGVYVKGEEYYTYHMELQLPDGRHKDMALTRESYYATAAGKPYPVTLIPGLLGWPVMRR